MSAAPLLEARGIAKRFGGVTALAGVDLVLEEGEVHVVAGENGAGKSTLMKVLAGLVQPDAGAIRIAGQPVVLRSPRDAIAHGVTLVTQEGSLAPDLTVAENVFLGREREESAGSRRLDPRALEERARVLLDEVGASGLDPATRAGALGVAVRQLVEVARALARRGRVLILDEPTAPLGEREVPALFAAIDRLRARGVGILYVSHRLEEFARIGQSLTVLRGGTRVHVGPMRDASIDAIVSHMAGHAGGAAFPSPSGRPAPDAPVLLEARGLAAGPLEGVDLALRAGEIVGVAGLVGSGRTSLCRALFGALPLRAGSLRLDGQPVVLASPADAVRAGIGLVPEDRRLHALAPDLGVGANVTLASIGRRFRGVLAIDATAERLEAERLAGALAIRCGGLDQPVLELSGGNQQKVVVARWLCADARVLLCDEPARGVDVGARAELFAILGELAGRGRAILVVSSALPELLGLCHRIVVLFRGRIVAEVDPARIDEPSLVHLMSLGAARGAA